MENALLATELQAGFMAQGRIPDHFGQRKITKLSNLSAKNDQKKDWMHLLLVTNMRSHSGQRIQSLELQISKTTD